MKGFLIWNNDLGKFFFRHRDIVDGEERVVDYDLRVDDLPIEIDLGNYYSLFTDDLDGKKYIGYSIRKGKLFDIYRKSGDGLWHRTNWGGDILGDVLSRAKVIAKCWDERYYGESRVGVKVLDSSGKELFIWERVNENEK